MAGYVARVRHDDPPDGAPEFKLLVNSVARRWSELDPLLPDPSHPRQSSYPLLTVTDTRGKPAATGTMHYSWYQPGEVGRTWGVPDQHWLTPVVGGPDPEGALDSLLSSWREQLEQLPTGTGSESAALLTWPSRDISGIRPMQRHGLQPFTVLAARRHRRGVPPSLPPRDVTIRLAEPQDIAAVVGLVMEEHRYEEHFGGVFIQSDTAEQTRRVVARALVRRPSWIWLAERRGRPVGLVWVSPPTRARWVGPLVRSGPAAYIGYAIVADEMRGQGIGTALINEAHQAMDSQGVAVTLLNYAVLNPVSGPFWHRMGYRPLWTTWETRPALSLR